MTKKALQESAHEEENIEENIDEMYEEDGSVFPLYRKLENGIDKLINSGDHRLQYFEAKRFIKNCEKATHFKVIRKYLSLISQRVPSHLIKLVTEIRAIILLQEDAAQ